MLNPFFRRALSACMLLMLSAAVIAEPKRLFSAIGIQSHSAQADIEAKAAPIKARQKSSKHGYFRADIKALDAPSITIELPDGSTWTLVKKYLKSLPTHQAWYGVDERNGIHLTLTITGHKLSGVLHAFNANYTIDFVGGDSVYLIADVDRNVALKDHPIGASMAPPPQLEKYEQEYQQKLKRERDKDGGNADQSKSDYIEALATGVTRIDLMIGYTSEAIKFFGNETTLIQAIRDAANRTNSSFIASGVTIELVAVDISRFAFSESQATLAQTRDEFAARADTRQRRNEVFADVAILVAFPNSSGCGLAYQGPNSGSAFAVVHVSCLRSGFALPHEFGHLSGADHNIGASDPPLTTSGSAHGYPGSNDSITQTSNGITWYNCFHTIMAYPSTNAACTTARHGYWSSSSKQVFFSPPGTYWPTGSVSANNAAKLNENATVVAAFRVAIGGAGTGGNETTTIVQKIIRIMQQLLDDN